MAETKKPARATAPCSSRSKYEKEITSHAHAVVRMFVYGGNAVVVSTKALLRGCVMTQSVRDAEPVSSTYSFNTVL